MTSPHGWDTHSLGNESIAAHRKTAFLCSRDYPASAVLRIYDWAQAMRANSECVISGFHSALERDVLDILIIGNQPLILAAARGLPKRFPTVVRRAVDEGRLLIVSPFPASVTRITAATSRERNRFMLAFAERIVVGYANPNGTLAQALAAAPSDKSIIRLVD